MSRNILIKNVDICLEDKILKNYDLFVSNGIIKEFNLSNSKEYNAEQIIDGKGLMLSPGFIDIHMHGCMGVSIVRASCDELGKLSASLSRNGTTSFLATMGASDDETIKRQCTEIRRAMEIGPSGAQIIGIHLEGPYLSLEKRGAQNPSFIRKPDIKEIKKYIELSGNSIKLVTVAPEEDRDFEFIKFLSQMNIKVSIGHSNASFDIVNESAKYGLSHAVHTCNGMGAMNHKEPGTLGGVLYNDSITAEIIADGYHVHPGVIKIISRSKGIDNIVLVTDSTEFAGMNDGIYTTDDGEIVVSNHRVTLRETGGLAGSAIFLKDAVKNMVKFLGILLYDAVRMASLNPAKVISVDGNKGSIEAGKHADLIIIDNDLSVYLSMINGEIAFNKLKA